MGIFNRLFGRGNNKSNNYNNFQEQQVGLSLRYSAGTVCEVVFSDLKQICDGKGNLITVQEAVLTYTEPDGSFRQNRVALDPQVMQDENGRYVYATEQYYRNLAAQNMPLVKGFFKKDQINALENGYIGHIGMDQRTGQYNRSYDKTAKSYYDELLCIKKMENQENRENSENALRDSLSQQIAGIEPHYKESHATVLTSEDYDKYFGSR